MVSTGSSPAHFYPSGVDESQRHDAPSRDLRGRVLSWSAPQSASIRRMAEIESTYTHPSYSGSGSGSIRSHHLFPLQTSEGMPPATVHLHAAAPVIFPAHTGHALQVRHAPKAADRDLHSSSPRWSPFGASTDNGDASVPRSDITEASAVHLTGQAWEEMVTTALGSSPRVHPPPLRAHSWDTSEPTGIQPLPLVINDAPTLEPTPPQNVDDNQDAHIFLCEWTDENGTCNREILGDRVWMSHHLSRQHNVVGHERSQRTCLWQGCTDTMNKGSLARHVVSRHLRAGATCGFCSKVYSRADVARRHTKKCKVANGTLGQRDETK